MAQWNFSREISFYLLVIFSGVALFFQLRPPPDESLASLVPVIVTNFGIYFSSVELLRRGAERCLGQKFSYLQLFLKLLVVDLFLIGFVFLIAWQLHGNLRALKIQVGIAAAAAFLACFYATYILRHGEFPSFGRLRAWARQTGAKHIVMAVIVFGAIALEVSSKREPLLGPLVMFLRSVFFPFLLIWCAELRE